MAITRTQLVDDDGSGTTGTVLNNADRQQLYNQIDAALAVGDVDLAAWTVYTPTWGTSGAVQPVLGNGTLTGRYQRTGKTIHFMLHLTTGSTTTYGDAGLYLFGVPVAPLASLHAFSAALLSPAGSGQTPCVSFTYGATQVYLVMANAGIVGPTIPFTWASAAQLILRGTYEVP